MRLLFVLSLVIYLLRSMKGAWIADDAYFSFRYARNLADGQGLVFNATERVEGITNLLWTFILALGQVLGFDLETLSQFLGILFAFVFFLFLGRFAIRSQWGRGTFLALTVCAVFLDYGTSGLESMMQVACLYAGLLLFFDRRYALAFLCLSLACWIRPDSVIFISVIAAYFLLIERRASFLEKCKALLPALLLLCLLQAFRLSYYGDFFPNTFYARSVLASYFAQGARYIALFFQSVWWIPISMLCLFLPAWRHFSWKHRTKYKKDALLLALILVWFLYVLQVGGDFMFGRFLLAILPALFLFLERVQARLLARRFWPVIALLMTLGQTLSLDVYRKKPLPVILGISDEARVYTRERRAKLKTLALSLRPVMEAAQPIVAFGGAQAALLYYWNIPGIEAVTGLTDRVIARQNLSLRGRVGHEKEARLDYLKARGVNLLLHHPLPSENAARDTLQIKDLGIFPVLCYDQRLELLQEDDRIILKSLSRKKESRPGEDECGLHF